MKLYNRLIIFLVILHATSVHAGIFDFFKFATKKSDVPTTKIRLPLGIAEKKEQLGYLENELTELQNGQKEFLDKVQGNLDQTTEQINDVKKQIKEAPQEAPFLNSLLSVWNETYQTLFTLQFSYKEILKVLEQHIALLEDFLKDPEFKSLNLKLHSFYTFEELQELS